MLYYKLITTNYTCRFIPFVLYAVGRSEKFKNSLTTQRSLNSLTTAVPCSGRVLRFLFKNFDRRAHISFSLNKMKNHNYICGRTKEQDDNLFPRITYTYIRKTEYFSFYYESKK